MSGNETRLLALRVPAQPDQLRVIRKAVREQIEAFGCSERWVGDVVMAVDEACQNIIRHAYDGDPDDAIEIEILRRDGEVIFCLRDFAPPVDPAKIKPRDLDDVKPGGLGTHLIREVMDEMEFIPPPSGAGNLLRMVKRIE